MNSHQKRWYPRFSLRGMLIAVSILAVCCGSWVYRAEQQRRAVKHFTSRGVLIGYQPTSAPSWLIRAVGEQYVYEVSLVYLRHKPVSAADLAVLPVFAKLDELDLAHTSVVDNDLSALYPLQTLRKLSVWGSKVTPAGIAPIAKLPHLEWLLISSDQFDERAIESLKKFPQLKHLGVIEIVPRGRPPKHSISDQRLAQLNRALPGVKIDLGLEIPRSRQATILAR